MELLSAALFLNLSESDSWFEAAHFPWCPPLLLTLWSPRSLISRCFGHTTGVAIRRTFCVRGPGCLRLSQTFLHIYGRSSCSFWRSDRVLRSFFGHWISKHVRVNNGNSWGAKIASKGMNKGGKMLGRFFDEKAWWPFIACRLSRTKNLLSLVTTAGS